MLQSAWIDNVYPLFTDLGSTMETIETKSGKKIRITQAGVRRSVRNAHRLIKRGLPGGEAGPYRYDPETDSIVERATGERLGRVNWD